MPRCGIDTNNIIESINSAYVGKYIVVEREGRRLFGGRRVLK